MADQFIPPKLMNHLHLVHLLLRHRDPLSCPLLPPCNQVLAISEIYRGIRYMKWSLVLLEFCDLGPLNASKSAPLSDL